MSKGNTKKTGPNPVFFMEITLNIRFSYILCIIPVPWKYLPVCVLWFR